jgi:succinate dehydrogenase/fumarate reductase flavoprotein subunit
MFFILEMQTEYVPKYSIDVPSTITGEIALDFLLNARDDLPEDWADYFSKKAGELYRQDAWAAFCQKIVAVKSFDRINRERKKPIWELTCKAAYAYGKAAKNLELYHLIRSAVRCRMEAHRRYCEAIPRAIDERKREELVFMAKYEEEKIQDYFAEFSLERLGFFV